MGGAVGYRGNTTPTAEWNFWVDPHAAADALAHAPAPVTLCSLEVTEQFLVDPPRLDRLVSDLGPTRFAEHLPEILRFYFEFHQAQGEGYQAQIHDLLTCMIAVETVRYGQRGVQVDVDTQGERRGTSFRDAGGGEHPPGHLSRHRRCPRGADPRGPCAKVISESLPEVT
ncbi:nucleoside hydrolase [Corynebacterium suedekumii]|nr:nucleoside hydrolase [Corynebacterium suedekumii]